MKPTALYPLQWLQRDERLAAVRATDWLCLAAAPTFAIMALLSGIHGGSMQNMLCLAPGNGWTLNEMCLMYLLMSAFHLEPWLRFISRRSNAGNR